MPIDLGLLRSKEEGGNVELVREWQKTRKSAAQRRQTEQRTDTSEAELNIDIHTSVRSNDEILVQRCISDVQVLELERHAARKQLHEHFRGMKECQRQLNPKTTTAEIDSASRSHARQRLETLQKALPLIETRVDDLTSQLDLALSRLANEVDLDLFIAESHEDTRAEAALSPSCKIQPDVSIIDPLFCLGGYETIQNNHGTTMTILTGPGVVLSRSITDGALHCFSSDRYQPVSLSSSCFSVETVKRLHALLGCSSLLFSSTTEDRQRCRICHTSESHHPLRAPSVIMLSNRHLHRTYWDRQLPLGTIACVNPHQPCCGHGVEASLDDREESRRGTFPKKQQLRYAWFHPHRVEVHVLTGNTMAESRHVQVELAKMILEFHRSLLLMMDVSTNGVLRLRSLSPDKLLLSEASRLVVEGFLPSLNAYVVLGYVSNFTDFVARELKTKCGDNGFVHTIHGVVCSVPESLEWMLQNNIVSDNGNHGIGVGLVPLFANGFGLGNTESVLLPLKRRVQHGKGGKLIVNELRESVVPRPLDANTKTTESTETLAFTVDNSARTPIHAEPFALNRLPTPSEISAEALSCPFDFLPLYR